MGAIQKSKARAAHVQQDKDVDMRQRGSDTCIRRRQVSGQSRAIRLRPPFSTSRIHGFWGRMKQHQKFGKSALGGGDAHTAISNEDSEKLDRMKHATLSPHFGCGAVDSGSSLPLRPMQACLLQRPSAFNPHFVLLRHLPCSGLDGSAHASMQSTSDVGKVRPLAVGIVPSLYPLASKGNDGLI